MAYRRKYKSGGRVPDAAEALPAMESTEVLLPPPEEPDPIPPGIDDDDAVRRAALATERAEQLQRAHMQAQMQRPTVAQVIDNSPGLSDHKKNFLRANPAFVTDRQLQPLLAKHYQAALAAGYGDDTPEIDAAIMRGVAADIEAQREAQRQAQSLRRSDPPPMEQPRPTPPPSPQLAPAPAPQLPPASLPPIKKSAPMAAPVSRNVPSAGGQSAAEMRSVTLSAEERIIARNSFGAIKGPNGKMVDLTDAEKERLFAQNKAKMLRMRAQGLLNE
jgi:hypothetical protein